MESDIQLLELASGIKDSLIKAGFTTISFILSSTTADISERLGIDHYVAQIIFEEAKKKIREVVIADTATTVNKGKNFLVKLDKQWLFFTILAVTIITAV